MTELFLLCSLIIGHFVGDFVFQTRYMGNNKGSNVSVLLDHVFVYTCILCLVMLPFVVLHLGVLGVITLIPSLPLTSGCTLLQTIAVQS